MCRLSPPPLLLAALKMLELGEEQDDEKDQYANRHVVTVEQLKDQGNATAAAVVVRGGSGDVCGGWSHRHRHHSSFLLNRFLKL